MKRKTLKRTVTLLFTVALLVFYNLMLPSAGADSLTSRRVVIGTSTPSAITTHDVSFDVVTAGVLGSVEIEYCSNSPLIGIACTAPTGLDASAAILSAQSGATGFSIDPSSTSNRLVLTRVPVAAAAGPVNFTFSNITNPSGVNQSTFIRISTFASNNATGSRIDSGSVVISINSGLGVGGYVPPFLVFCVGMSVGSNCSSSTGTFGDFGELSPVLTKTLTSQFSGATNDPGGYSTFVAGTTMTSGSSFIANISASAPSSTGIGQFGFNLRSNSAPGFGTNPTGAGTAAPVAGYNSPNFYKFNNGDQLTSSLTSTEYNIFTLSYIVNVPSTQPPGLYSTTLTFIATAAF